MIESGNTAANNPPRQSFISSVQPRIRLCPTHKLSAYTSFVAHNSTILLSSPTRLTAGRTRLDRQVFRNYPDCFLRAATPNRLFASIFLDSFHKPFIRSARTRACNDASLNSYPQYANELWTGLSRASLLPDCPPVRIRTFMLGSPPATLTFA